MQDLALGLVEPHTIGLGPWIQPVQVPLQSLPPLKQINTPTQLGAICKLTEGALDPFTQIIDKDVKQNCPQHRALGNTACDRPPTGVNSIHHHSLGPAIQPVLYPVKSTPVQAMSSQFVQENAFLEIEDLAGQHLKLVNQGCDTHKHQEETPQMALGHGILEQEGSNSTAELSDCVSPAYIPVQRLHLPAPVLVASRDAACSCQAGQTSHGGASASCSSPFVALALCRCSGASVEVLQILRVQRRTALRTKATKMHVQEKGLQRQKKTSQTLGCCSTEVRNHAVITGVG
ncbi:hypothetical protein QYF61_020409 [Mycteria americana]|uniref:Uncharacterized protein n=1 Tax=Mycteria americana TaxID=33587 RepID=A0AAN7N4D1_MYCAM|nr:hypothetical protein QYF61_020409 [Mycteria americana]